MYDTGKILIGVVIFLILLAFPVYYLAASGEGDAVPDLATPEGDQCVEPADWMRDNHMTLLVDWREGLVRDGIREYVATDGTKYENISLTGTCLDKGCHSSKDEFCDRCHTYVGAEPDCWSCHVEGEE